ncbi:hypothetical protein RJ639_028963 [Escallonia herrerae]|uniref:Uncharacterized protein n=1 Tax=Escallonia herrerae TaxID=1293975 RepID=A0AA89BL01_9ASTE|nr:hypothetical protein RJ639_028963 [Escallonia herrerae]
MRPSDPKVPNFNHPILHLLQQCKTLGSLKQAHAQMITTGLILHTYPLSRILLLSSTLATSLSYALAIFNQVPNPTIFLFNTLISSSLTPKHRHTHVALSLYSCILTHTSLKPNNYTYPSLFKACGCHPWLQHGLALHTHHANDQQISAHQEVPGGLALDHVIITFQLGFFNVENVEYLLISNFSSKILSAICLMSMDQQKER